MNKLPGTRMRQWLDELQSDATLTERVSRAAARLAQHELLDIPVVINTRLLTCAGRAFARRIELNPDLVFEESREDLFDTLMHEAAHIIGHNLGGAWGHDSYWRLACKWLGIQPSRCHSYASMRRRSR